MHRDSFPSNSISIQQSSESIQAPGQWGALWATPSCDLRCTDRGCTRPNRDKVAEALSQRLQTWKQTCGFILYSRVNLEHRKEIKVRCCANFARRFWNTVATRQTCETTMKTFCSNPSLNQRIQNKRNSTDPTNWRQVLSTHSIDWYWIESWPKESKSKSNRIVRFLTIPSPNQNRIWPDGRAQTSNNRYKM